MRPSTRRLTSRSTRRFRSLLLALALAILPTGTPASGTAAWPGPGEVEAAGQALDPTDPGSLARLYEARLARHPRDLRSLLGLADALIQKARVTSEAALFDRAEQLLLQALAIEPAYAEARRHLAFVLYTRHDFAGSAREAEAALRDRPSDAQAWGILGDARLEVGRYEEARAAYRRMAELGADLYAEVRQAGLDSVTGNPERAVTRLERAIAAGRVRGRPAEAVAWAEWQLGQEHLQLGRLAEAERAYQAALSTQPGYYRALAGLGQVRAVQGRDAEAVRLLTGALAVVPLPDYAALLGDVHRKAGRLGEARRQYDLVEYIGRLSALNQVPYNRELALFLADHGTRLDEALALARRELEVRQDVYAHDVLAWALVAAGRLDEAEAPMRAALRLGTRDARLAYHAGVLAERQGRLDEARRYFHHALAINPVFHLFQADDARQRLARLDGAAPAPAAREGGSDGR